MPRKKQGRNSNGESSLYLGSDKRWHGRVTVGVKDNGQPDRRHVSAKERAEVVRKVRELERKRDAGTVQKAGTSWTVAQWLDHWLNDIAVMTTTENGWDAYHYAVKHLVPGVGAHRLTKLAPHHLESRYRKMLANGARKGTVHQVHRTIRAPLNDAAARDFLTKNPAKVAKAPTPDDEEIEPFSERRDSSAVHGGEEGAQLDSMDHRYRARPSSGRSTRPSVVGPGLRGTDLKVRRSQLRPKCRHGCEQPCGRKYAGHCPQRINIRPETKDTKSKAVSGSSVYPRR